MIDVVVSCRRERICLLWVYVSYGRTKMGREAMVPGYLAGRLRFETVVGKAETAERQLTGLATIVQYSGLHN